MDSLNHKRLVDALKRIAVIADAKSYTPQVYVARAELFDLIRLLSTATIPERDRLFFRLADHFIHYTLYQTNFPKIKKAMEDFWHVLNAWGRKA